ncbi:MAG: DUF2971 domain-containing protein [Nitrospirota bacterium]
MIEDVKDAGEFLYHYTSMETAAKILESGAIRLGRYRDTNDPKERKEWHFPVGTNIKGRDIAYHSTQELSDWLSESLKSSARLACFCTDTPPLTGDHLKEIFDRGYCKPRMWAQYGAAHTGVCLIFRLRELLDAARAYFNQSVPLLYGPVQYVNRSVVPNLFSSSPDEQAYILDLDHYELVGKEKYLLDHVVTHRRRLFFEKMTDWENEREWRIVVLIKSEVEIFIPFRSSLAGIMFGESSDEQKVVGLMEQADVHSPWFMALKWKNCSPWYDYENKLFIKQHRLGE